MTDLTDKMVYSKKPHERVVLTRNEFRGKSYIDIRTQFIPADSDIWVNTKKGVMINFEDIDRLIADLEELKRTSP